MTICYVQRIQDVFIIYPDQVVNDSAGNYIQRIQDVFIIYPDQVVNDSAGNYIEENIRRIYYLS